MEKTFPTPEPVRLYVENGAGFVSVSATETVTSAVRLEADSPEAEDLVERAIVECRPKGGRHHLVVRLPKMQGLRFLRRSGVTVRVTVPEGSDIDIATASADADVSGPVGDVKLATASGDLSSDDASGHVVAKSASGNLTVGNVGGELRMHTASGDLRCSAVAGRALFASASGDLEIGSARDQVEVKTASGNTRLGELAHGARITGHSGDVRVLALAGGSLHVRCVSGNVSVGVAQGVDVRVDVETVSGSVHSDIELERAPAERRGAARAEITVRNVSGDIAIEHALEQVA
jgi:DUF4097 and DUF4098 domain-containing protein YvlB